jgi:hypothetical protein
MLIIGTDEAGFGPTLGPLVIVATAWNAPSGSFPKDDFRRMSAGLPWDGEPPIALIDSKQLHQRQVAQPLRRLELAIEWLLPEPRPIDSMGALLESLGGTFVEPIGRYRGASALPGELYPLTLTGEERRWIRRAKEHWKDAGGPTCVSVATQLVEPHAFNEGCSVHGNKASLLSVTTLGLVRTLHADLPGHAECLVISDRHGGRQRYGGLLQQRWPGYVMQVEHESPVVSRYRLRSNHGEVAWQFLVGGEASPPVAAASIIAKYIRERWMLVFNEQWRQYLPTLRPTAGYPVDARRFLSEIDATLHRLGIAQEEIARQR